MSVTIYHNPRCSKSRAALQLLRERGVEPEIVEYLKTPPDAATVTALLRKLGMTARDVLRRGEAPYRELALGDPAKDENELVAAIVAHPVLLERPIAVRGAKAVLGRPPERVLDLL